MTERTCDEPDCDRPHRARGLCSMHWKRQHGRPNDKQSAVEVECPTCGEASSKRDDGPSTRRFCSLVCRDLWRIDQPNDPMYSRNRRGPRLSRLPADHPVRILMRQDSWDRAKSPLRRALEAEDWSGVMAAILEHCVTVNDCVLWSRSTKGGYGSVVVGTTWYGVHRLVAMADRRGDLDPRMPVHHTCAERLCCNPHHLQVVTPIDNIAEMLERRYYVARIEALEQALCAIAPRHPLLPRRSSIA